MFAAAKVELRNSERSSIGSRWCCSSRRNTTRKTVATTKSPSTSGSPQPRSFDSISANVEREERDRRRREAREVQSLLARGVPRLVDEDARGKDAEDPDRDVDVEDPAPADVLGDRAADERPDRERHRRHAGPDADRHPTLARWKCRGDDREGRRVHQRGAAPCTTRAPISRPALFAKPQRNDDAVKMTSPMMKIRAASEHVGELAAGEEQDAERQRVAVDDPLQLRDRDAEIACGSTAERRSRPCCRA